jgi:hypothetical protein
MMINRHAAFAFLLAGVLGAAAIASAQVYTEPATSPQTKAPATGDTVSPGQISAHPDKYIGSKVQIRNAEVETVHSQQVFTLDEDRLAAGPDVAVLIPKMVARASIAEDAKVDVKGTVRKFVAKDIKRDYSGITLTSKVESELEGRGRSSLPSP